LQHRFGADPSIIGRKLTLGVKPHTLIGARIAAIYPASNKSWGVTV